MLIPVFDNLSTFIVLKINRTRQAYLGYYFEGFTKSQQVVGQISHQVGDLLQKEEEGQRVVDQLGMPGGQKYRIFRN